MNRRGFLSALVSLVAAPAAVVAAVAKPETMHVRFNHHGPATRIHWTKESAFIHTDAPKFKKIDMMMHVYDDGAWTQIKGSDFRLEEIS